MQLFHNGQDVAAALVREGLARVDEYSNAKELWTAQEEAQKARKNLWSNYDPEAEALANGDAAAAGQSVQPRKEYVDVVVSEVRGGTETEPFRFAVQILQNGGAFPSSAAYHLRQREPDTVRSVQAFPNSRSLCPT